MRPPIPSGRNAGGNAAIRVGRTRRRWEPGSVRETILIASPPPAAVGGIATHSALLCAQIAHARLFDQWWPTRQRLGNPGARAGLHALALSRWVSALTLTRPAVAYLQVSRPGLARDLAFAQVARRLGVPIVAHVHSTGFYEGPATAGVDRRLDAVVGTATRTIVMSRELHDQLRTRHPDHPEHVVYLRNPAPELPTPEAAPAREPGVTVLCVGEICRRKNQVALAEAVEHLAGQGRPIRLNLVGPWGDVSEQERRYLESCPSVRLSGTLTGAAKTSAYDSADIFALSSRSEGQPLAVLEAMTRGLPVVTTDVGGVAEMLAGSTGNRIVPADSPTALQTALDDLCRDPGVRAEVGAANRDFVARECSPRAHVAAILATVASAAGSGSGGEPIEPTANIPVTTDALATVTAVIPTALRNRAQLDRAIESTLRQTTPVDQVIVVVDRPDLPDPELPHHPDPRVQVVRNTRSRGPAGARNCGALLATSSHVAWLDDDDYWLPGKLAAQLGAARQARATDQSRDWVVAGRAELVSGDGSHLAPDRPPRRGEVLADYLFATPGMRRSPVHAIFTPTLLFPRALIVADPLDETLQRQEDYEWLLRVTDRGAGLVFVSAPVTVCDQSRATGPSQSQRRHPGDDERFARTHVLPRSRRAYWVFSLTYTVGNLAALGRRREAAGYLARGLTHGAPGKALLKAGVAVAVPDAAYERLKMIRQARRTTRIS